MSFHVFFELSTGLSVPITVPKGTLAQIEERIRLTEETLGLETEQYKDNPKHWKSTDPKPGVTDKVLCNVAEEHNKFVRWLYVKFADCSKTPAPDGELITPEQAAKFWHGLRIIDVPPEKWNADYYRARMEALYEAMRGRYHDLLSEGIVFDSKALTPQQASDVINLFTPYLDHHDIRLDVAKDTDQLASMADGEYEWCEKCGAVTYNHAENCRKRKCPVREELGIGKDND